MKKHRKVQHLVENFPHAFFNTNAVSSVHAKGEKSLVDLEKYLVAHEGEPKGPEDDDEPGE